MPKNLINYSDTIMYKIYCKNLDIHDIYVGHTTNFIKRKYHHKKNCENGNKKLKIYETICDNGGWENWEMTELIKMDFKNVTEVRIKEQEYYKLLTAQKKYLSVETEKKYFCKICNKQYDNSSDYEKHFTNKKHTDKILQNTAKITPKNPKIFYCKLCDFNSSNKKDYTRHLLTPKHQNTDKILTLTDTLPQETPMTSFTCVCGKEYKHRQSLFNHKKKCINNKTINVIHENEEYKIDIDKDDLIKYLMKENCEFKDMIIEQNKMVMKIYEKSENNTSICNSNINSHNKTFNLNVFLNEHCKDAMNITDFVDSLKLQLSDLENVGRLGFVEGISSIIVKNLKALEVHKRPVHCSDSKREVMYVKDEDKWEKENDDKNKLRKAIKKIANKNSRLLPIFKEKHPDCIKSISPFSDQYNKLIIEAMGGSGNEDIDNENKIIRKIAKEVTIDKNID